MADIRIEAFEKDRHQRAGFQCGKPPLADFIHALVTQYEKRRLGKTFVAVRTDEPTKVIGYYTLASGAVACANLPSDVAKKLPKHPVPVILLARLAIDRDEQKSQLREREATERAAAESALLKLYTEVWLPRVESGGVCIDPIVPGGRPLQTTLSEQKEAMIHEPVMELLTSIQPRVFGTLKATKTTDPRMRPYPILVETAFSMALPPPAARWALRDANHRRSAE